jgi:hypothetical protein
MVTTGWGCSCSVTIKWLAARGAPHATRMHKIGKSESTWQPSDWLQHFAEEERYLFPYFPQYVRRMLGRHHAAFRKQLREYGRIVDDALMQKHAAMEDTFTAKIAA